MTFYEWFVEMCVKHEKDATVVACDIGLSATSATYWKKGSVPKDTTIKRLEDYFGEKYPRVDDVLTKLKEEDRAFLHSYATMTDEQKNMMRIFAKGLKNGN